MHYVAERLHVVGIFDKTACYSYGDACCISGGDGVMGGWSIGVMECWCDRFMPSFSAIHSDFIDMEYFVPLIFLAKLGYKYCAIYLQVLFSPWRIRSGIIRITLGSGG